MVLTVTKTVVLHSFDRMVALLARVISVASIQFLVIIFMMPMPMELPA
jgi:hypothetical protein